jgi:hypothetical protein
MLRITCAMGKAGLTADRNKAFHEATMAALALEEFREQQGHYPATLGELVPRYLPAEPLDYTTGSPLRYKLKDKKPLLYGLGMDGKDDGGTCTDIVSRRVINIPKSGDWILYPFP